MNELAKKLGKVVVLYGGWSAERDVSIASGKATIDVLKQAGVDVVPLDMQRDVAIKLAEIKPDRVFIALHGHGGEDGVVQGVLESLDMPYTGSDVAASAITMDKFRFKQLMMANHIPVAPAMLWQRDCLDAPADIVAELGLPLCVKPNREGSSFGVTRVNSEEELLPACEVARQYGEEVIIEPWVNGKEYAVPILAGHVLPIVGIEPAKDFYDYDAKYTDDRTKFLCPITTIDEDIQHDLKLITLRAFYAAGCRHWGRADFIVTGKGEITLLEFNTIPGLTSHSLVPSSAKSLGISFDELIMMILLETLPQEERQRCYEKLSVYQTLQTSNKGLFA